MLAFKIKTLLATGIAMVLFGSSGIHSMESPTNRPQAKKLYETLQQMAVNDPNAAKVLNDFGNFSMNVQNAQLAVDAYKKLLEQSAGNGGQGSVGGGVYPGVPNVNTNPQQPSQNPDAKKLEDKFDQAIADGEIDEADRLFATAITQIQEKSVLTRMQNAIASARAIEKNRTRPKINIDRTDVKNVNTYQELDIYPDPRRDLIKDFIDGHTIDSQGLYTRWGLLKILQQTGIVVKSIYGTPLTGLHANKMIKDLRIAEGGAFSDKIYILTIDDQYLTPDNKGNNRYVIKNAVETKDENLKKETGNHPLKEMRDLDFVNQVIVSGKLANNPLNHAKLMGIGNSCFYVVFTEDGRSEKKYVVVLDAAEGEPVGIWHDRYKGEFYGGEVVPKSETIDLKTWDTIIYNFGKALGDLHLTLAKDKYRNYILTDPNATLKKFKTILHGDLHLENVFFNDKSTDGKPITFIDIASMADSLGKSPLEFNSDNNKRPDIFFLNLFCQTYNLEVNWDEFARGYAENFGTNAQRIEAELKDFFKNNQIKTKQLQKSTNSFIPFWEKNVQQVGWSTDNIANVINAWDQLPLEQKMEFIRDEILLETQDYDKAIKNSKYLIGYILSLNDKIELAANVDFGMFIQVAFEDVHQLFSTALSASGTRHSHTIRNSAKPSSRTSSQVVSFNSTAVLKSMTEQFWQNWDNKNFIKCNELWGQLTYDQQDEILKSIMSENNIQLITDLFGSVIPDDDKAAMFEFGQKLANDDVDVKIALVSGDNEDVSDFFNQLSPYLNATPTVSLELEDFRIAWKTASAKDLANLWNKLLEQDKSTALADLIFDSPLNDLEWFFHKVVSPNGNALFEQAKDIANNHPNNSAIPEENWNYLQSDQLPADSSASSSSGTKGSIPSTNTTSPTPSQPIISFLDELKLMQNPSDVLTRQNARLKLGTKANVQIPDDIDEILKKGNKTIEDFENLVDKIDQIYNQYVNENETTLKSQHAAVLAKVINQISNGQTWNDVIKVGINSTSLVKQQFATNKKREFDQIEENLILDHGWTNKDGMLTPPK